MRASWSARSWEVISRTRAKARERAIEDVAWFIEWTVARSSSTKEAPPQSETHSIAARSARREDVVDQRVGPGTVGVVQMRHDAVAGRRREVEALVEQVAPREAGAHEVPREAEERGPGFG